jgi:hypothetical protein
MRSWTYSSYIRRAFGAAVCLIVPFLFIVSLVIGLRDVTGRWFVGAWPLVWSGLIGGVNFYLSVMQSWVHRRIHGSLKDYRHVSGFPLIGWLGLIAALCLGWGAPGTALIGLVLCFIDTGGLVWLLLATWRDDSLWDGPPRAGV